MSSYAQILVIIGDNYSLMIFIFIMSILVLAFLGGVIYLISNSYLQSKINKYINEKLGDEWKKNIQKDIKNAMWKLKLNYLIRRNIDKKDNDYDERFKPSIFLELYRDRDK